MRVKKRDDLMGAPCTFKPPSTKRKRTGIVIFGLGISIAVGAAVIYLARDNFFDTAAQNKLSDRSDVTTKEGFGLPAATKPSESQDADAGSLTRAEREYRDMVEAEELVKLINKRSNKSEENAVDLSEMSDAARAKGEQAVKELRLRGAANQSDKILKVGSEQK